MQVIKTIKDMQGVSKQFRIEKKTIGCVPTMGALHEGHLSLVRRSNEESDVTVVSIFVNPAQFGPQEDFKRYPRDREGDLEKLSALGTDVVFIPEDSEMYPEGFSSVINIGSIGDILCGVTRQGHFNGVATVVAKLFNIVIPDKAYFGQKDYQQTVVIKKLVKELNFTVDIIMCPIVRESDSLAMSSRNSYLKGEERRAARVLYKALRHGEDVISRGAKDVKYVRKEVEAVLKTEPLAQIEYIEVLEPLNLEKLHTIKETAVICIAAKIGTTRLIDNVIIS
jgi:pantoate--beta-alanine ligase